MPGFVELKNQRTGLSLGKNISVASTFAQRLIGLLGRSGLEFGQGLLIHRCNQVHMLFMRFEIGILFLSPELKILAVKSCLRPWQVSNRIADATAVLELPVGVIESAVCQVGDQLIIV